MKFIDQTVTFPLCPEPKRPAARRKLSAGNSFLFVNSNHGDVPKQSRQSMRSHVMQHARSQKKWSTSKRIASSTYESPRDSPEDTENEAVTVASTNVQLQLSSKRQAMGGIVYQNLAPSPNYEPQGPYCSPKSSAGYIDCSSPGVPPLCQSDLALDPYCALPVTLDPASRWMLDQCKLVPYILPHLVLYESMNLLSSPCSSLLLTQRRISRFCGLTITIVRLQQ
jgi:hypothetical protein